MNPSLCYQPRASLWSSLCYLRFHGKVAANKTTWVWGHLMNERKNNFCISCSSRNHLRKFIGYPTKAVAFPQALWSPLPLWLYSVQPRQAAAVIEMGENNFLLSTFYVLSIELHALPSWSWILTILIRIIIPILKVKKLRQKNQLQSVVYLTQQSVIFPLQHTATVVCWY